MRTASTTAWRTGLMAMVLGVCLAGTTVATAAAAEFGLREPPRVTWHEPLDVGIYESYGAVDFTYEPGALNAVPLTPDLRAGARADLSVDLQFIRPDETGPAPAVRDIEVDLPAGFVGDPSNYAKCTAEDLERGKTVYCTPGSQVGVVTAAQSGGTALAAPVFSMATDPGEPARLVFSLVKRTFIEITPRTDGDYGLTAHVGGILENSFVEEARITLWGNPSDPVHDRLRTFPEGGFRFLPDGSDTLPNPSTFPQLPFLAAPPRCDAPLSSTVRIRSWPPANAARSYEVVTPARTNCEELTFDASASLSPSTRDAGQPTGLGVDLDVPQDNDVGRPATPHVKDVSVTLPEGVAISPGGADGLAACTDAQLATDSRAPETCPEASKVGTTTITTPILDEQLTGNVYLGQQLSQDPASGDMYRLFVTAFAKGVRIKLRGNVVADPATGRLTATFRQNPQLPFSNLRLDLKGGPRALLANPTACGTGSTRLDATSYAGNVVSSESPYVVDQNCPTGAFAPGFVGGTLDPFAGRLSPFTTTVVRPDGQADLASLNIDLPPGLLGALASVPVCGEAQAASGTCGADSRIGSTAVSVGSGSAPFSLPGSVSLAGPYKGQPFSLSIAVPAKAGPLDLGLVVVRSPLVVDAARAQVSAPVDALPQIVGGVPLRYRTIAVALDRPGFMFNATNCSPAEVVATLTSTTGQVVRQPTRYQPQNCDRLRLRPALRLQYSGSLRRGQNPKLTADLSQAFQEANLRRVAVALPRISSLAPENAETLCSVEQFAARNCPSGSIVGRASATTPALPTPLAGPVFLVQGQRTTATGRVVRTLPKLFLDLEGSGVPLDLIADTSVDRRQRLVTTFANVPDAPISSFRLEIDGGERGILTAVQDPCQPVRRGGAVFNGQNGARDVRTFQITAPGCAIRVATQAGRRGVRAVVGNIAPGRVTLRGRGLRRATTTLRSGDRTALTARLSRAASSTVRRGGTVRTTVRVTFNPAGEGRTRTITRRITIRG